MHVNASATMGWSQSVPGEIVAPKNKAGIEGVRPIAVDLFSGAGGLSLGMEQAGFDVVAAVEYDPVHAAVHEFNFPRASTICADVSALDVSALMREVKIGVERHGRSEWDGQIDVVFGGPPCQGFSNIGKRLIDDKRNALVFHFMRIVSELRPRYAVMENVPGMTRGGHAGILHRLIEEFGERGYVVTQPWQVLNAADFGAPQDRRRLFLLLARDDMPPISYPTPTVRAVPKRGGSPGDGDLPRGPTVMEAIGDIPDLDLYEELLAGDHVLLSDREIRDKERNASSYVRRLRGIEDDATDFSYPRAWDRNKLTGSARTIHTAKSVARFAKTVPGETEPISRFYRLHPDGLSNTLRAGSGSERGAFTSPRPLHPFLPRVISVREAARLHSFPDWFRFHETKWHGFRQIGNAVVPLVGRAVGSSVMEALAAKPVRPKRAIPLGDDGALTLTMTEATEKFDVDAAAIPATRSRGAKPGVDRDEALAGLMQVSDG